MKMRSVEECLKTWYRLYTLSYKVLGLSKGLLSFYHGIFVLREADPKGIDEVLSKLEDITSMIEGITEDAFDKCVGDKDGL